MIELKNISYAHSEKSPKGIFNLSMSIASSESVCLIGPSGSGKTTLLKIIADEISVQKGEISHNINNIQFYENKTINSTQVVLDYICTQITHDIDEEKKINLARLALSDLGITNEMNYPVNSLSEGQKQRLGLAILFANMPELILLDEPFSALDLHLKSEIMDILLTNCKQRNITLIWSSHHQEHAMAYSDKVAVLQFGNCEQFDSPTTIYNKPTNLFVAKFLGQNNVSSVELKDNKGLFYGHEFNFEELNDDGTYLMSLRPEKIKSGIGSIENLKSAHFLGQNYLITLDNGLKLYSEQPQEKFSYSFDAQDIYCIGRL